MLQPILSTSVVCLAIVYVLVALLRGRWQTATIALFMALSACIALEISDFLVFLEPGNLMRWKKIGLVAEACLPFTWLFFSLTYARQWQQGQVSSRSKLLLAAMLFFPTAAFFLSPLELFYSPDFVDEKILFLRSPGHLFYVLLLGALVVSLVYLERTYVSLSRPDRWRAKFEIVGAGLILAVLVIYYSQALLYRSLDMNLIPVRTASMILALGFMAYSRVYRGEVVRIEVSRHVAYRSVVFLVVGIYLIGLGLFGTGVRYFDMAQNRTILVALAVFSGVLLVVLFLSERIRRRIQVMLHKNFYQKKYDYRNEWLQFTARLAEAKNREELEAGILAFFAETFSLHGAALFLRDQQSGRFLCSAQHEMDMRHLSPAEGLPEESRMRQDNWVVDLGEHHEMLAEDWRSLYQKGCKFLVPLCFQQRIEGVIALGERVYDGDPLTYEDFDLMKTLSHQAIGVLLSRKLYADLVAANEMAAIGRVSTFVIHDLKNLVSSLALVVDNARDYIDDAEFRADMFETLDNTVENMNRLIVRLQNVKHQPTLEFADTDLLALAQRAVERSGHSAVQVGGSEVMVRADSAEVDKVLLNLLHNAREASTDQAPIEVEVGQNEQAFIRVTDHGAGMSEAFIRQRLFKPFETTKKKGMGIGLYQCRQVIEGHGGRIEVQSQPGVGSTFTLWLPVEM
ncbi:XrtA/PEP-CTERM system histidine kinase PrsK [uncultured Desulfuromonas sp.]|uniref:XrtA/PEP-CTERM system histidine kinase PrsK n=1 Tax=uncultured Desulfuromonas sp. TaxID=181013 RepID=UPI002AAB653A|nr:XrtA/PEP-CTERM system histidine kinase PrsK [uncultured Desulfuromonas sp.]